MRKMTYMQLLFAASIGAFFFPVSIALAQEAMTQAPSNPLFTILSAVIPIITLLFTWVGNKIASANEAAKQKHNVEAAFIRLGAVAFAMAGDLWGQLASEYQNRVADGSIDAKDREAFRALIDQNIEKYTSRAELEKLAAATGLPLPGVIAWIAEWVIDRLTKANDPKIMEVPSMYPPRDANDKLTDLSQGG